MERRKDEVILALKLRVNKTVIFCLYFQALASPCQSPCLFEAETPSQRKNSTQEIGNHDSTITIFILFFHLIKEKAKKNSIFFQETSPENTDERKPHQNCR